MVASNVQKVPKEWTVVSHEEDGMPVRRYHANADRLLDCDPYCNNSRTVYDTLKYAATKWPKRQSLGRRKLLGIKAIEKKVPVPSKPGDTTASKEYVTKTFTQAKYSPYEWFTYAQLWEKTNILGRALVSQDIGLTFGDRVQIFAPTSVEWMLFNLSCMRQGISVATAYDTLGVEGLSFSVEESESKIIFCRVDKLHNAATVSRDSKSAHIVVCFGQELLEHDKDSVKSYESGKAILEEAGKRLLSLEELFDIGQDAKDANPDAENEGDHPPSADDIALIMYTSGSTGNPKGVVVKHKNMATVIGSIKNQLDGTFIPEDTIVAYLPLAHILEYAVEHTMLSMGLRIGYGSPRSLTTSMVYDCLGDLEALKPTLMTGVPQVWNGIAREVKNQLKAKGSLINSIFNYALKSRWNSMSRNATAKYSFLEKKLFAKVKKLVGGNLRLALSGGAAISPEVQQFLSCLLCPIVQGYGMTETCGVIGIQKFETFRLNAIGPTIGSLEVKLVDCPDAGYFSKNNQGEIWVRGPSICSGYLNSPPGTEETFTPDGWMRTGDIGQWGKDGQLSVIDRLKNLVKMSNGEYIALEQLESIYGTIPYLTNLCMHGRSDRSQPIAIVSLDERITGRLAEAAGLGATAHKADVANSEAAKKIILKCFDDLANEKKLLKSQRIKKVIIDQNEWNPDNDMLTAANKLKRRAIIEANKDEMEAVYATYE